MYISYQPLWNILKESGMRKEGLQIASGFTINMIVNMGKGKNIIMEMLVRICQTLNCDILDVIELEQDEIATKSTKRQRLCFYLEYGFINLKGKLPDS